MRSVGIFLGSIQFCSLNIFAMADSFWNFKFLTVTLFLLDGFVVKPFAKTSEESQVMWWSKTVFDDVSNQNQNRCLIVVNCFCLNNFYERFNFAGSTSSKLFQSVKSYFVFAHETFEGPTVFFGMRYVFKQRCTKNPAKPANPRSLIYSQKI